MRIRRKIYRWLFGRSQRPALVKGLWLRALNGRLDVLVEQGNPPQWTRVISYRISKDEVISHITEPIGIRRAPIDDRAASPGSTAP